MDPAERPTDPGAGVTKRDQKVEFKKKRAGAMPKKPRFSPRRPAGTFTNPLHTPLTAHSRGDDEDSEGSGVILLFFAGTFGIFPQNPAPK